MNGDILKEIAEAAKFEMKIFEKETNYRTNFVINSLQKRISKLKSKNIYKDMNRGK